jgi:hypothetical protein
VCSSDLQVKDRCVGTFKHCVEQCPLVGPGVHGLQGVTRARIHDLDVGYGNGRALNMMGAEFPNSRFTGSICQMKGYLWAGVTRW